MCILSYLPPGTPIDEKGFYNGGMNNPDGHGWAIVVDDEKIIMGKSMDLDKAIDEFKTAREKYVDGPALFHSRWATHGLVNVSNVHPFHVNHSNKTVVAHNGIFRAAAQPDEGDWRSDTRKFAEEILFKNFRRLDRAGVKQALTNWCGTNKLVILTVDPRYSQSAYIINEKMGHWDSATGIWHSNRDYLFYTTKGYSGYSGCYGYEQWPSVLGKKGGTKTSTLQTILDDMEEDDRCLWCDTGRVGLRGYCKSCFCCQDCTEDINVCQCYLSEAEEAALLKEWEEARRWEDDERWHDAVLIDVDEEPWVSRVKA